MPVLKIENRDTVYAAVTDIDIENRDDSQRYVNGIGIVYDKEVELWPGYREKIRKGAFDEDLKNTKEIKSFYNHNPSMVLSTTRSTPALQLIDTEKDLRYKSPIPPTSYGNDLAVNLERKNVRGSSFSFSVAKDGDILTRDEKGVYHREIVKANLYEIGPVTNPAYGSTTAQLRSVEELCGDLLMEYESRNNTQTADLEKNVNELELRKKLLILSERG
ncbi:MAG: HK97 family phage prohead protease [Chitinispirillaceae bacterium]|nr:HK97 family phage prohead protease [Chitinispirillaceae bacterium]